ncbi:MAG TPA: cytochrome c oxidase subunit CcoM [Cellvibrionaceae bacterium]
MYLDSVVLSGIAILVLTCLFLGGVGWYVRQQIIEDAKLENQHS